MHTFVLLLEVLQTKSEEFQKSLTENFKYLQLPLLCTAVQEAYRPHYDAPRTAVSAAIKIDSLMLKQFRIYQ